MKVINETVINTSPYFTTGTYVKAAVDKNLKLPNCTTFCMCAWHYVMDATKSYQLFKGRSAGGFGDAKTWYANYLFEKGSVPRVASIAVWDGTCGHVAFVKSFSDDGNGYYTINVYESYYAKFKFREHTYKVKVGIANSSDGLGKFIGFCYHPYYEEEQEKEEKKEPTYERSKIYTTQCAVNVRFGPGTSYKKKTRAQLTTDARKHATWAGALKKGTQVTCQGTSKDSDGNIWMKIPSGYIAAYLKEDDEIIVK